MATDKLDEFLSGPVRQTRWTYKMYNTKKALRVAVTAFMKNHVFTFVNKNRKDTKGLLIGLKFTGLMNLQQGWMKWPSL